jgi:hypothetical protein
MPQTKSRIVGSGNTVLQAQDGKNIAFLKSVQDTPPTPLGGGAGGSAVVIQPLDAQYPVEIVTSNAVGAGTLTLTLIEVWEEEAWQRIIGYKDAKSLVGETAVRGANDSRIIPRKGVFDLNTGDLKLTKIITTPSGVTRGKVYTGCVITNVEEGETVEIGSMTKDVTVTVMYTKVTPL